jgi:hypothetical protein
VVARRAHLRMPHMARSSFRASDQRQQSRRWEQRLTWLARWVRPSC